MTKAKELRELNLDELDQKLIESRHELFNLRFQLATGKQDNSARLNHVRKEIARVATLLRELERRAPFPSEVLQLGVSYATLQCAELLARGAPGIHFYTLNRSPATRAILAALRLLRPWVRREVVRVGADGGRVPSD